MAVVNSFPPSFSYYLPCFSYRTFGCHKPILLVVTFWELKLDPPRTPPCFQNLCSLKATFLWKISVSWRARLEISALSLNIHTYIRSQPHARASTCILITKHMNSFEQCSFVSMSVLCIFFQPSLGTRNVTVATIRDGEKPSFHASVFLFCSNPHNLRTNWLTLSCDLAVMPRGISSRVRMAAEMLSFCTCSPIGCPTRPAVKDHLSPIRS